MKKISVVPSVAPRILAIETSAKTFSIALSEGSALIAEVFWHSGANHSDRLIPALDWLLKETGWTPHSITKIAVSTGPGSFTGIRVGLTGARTLAHQLKVPLVGIDALEIVRHGVLSCVPKGSTVFTAIDALRDEVFVRGKKGIEIRPVDEVIRALKKEKAVIIAGTITTHYRHRFDNFLCQYNL